MKTQKKSWIQSLFAYAEGEKKKMLLSVILSVVSVTAGLALIDTMQSLDCPVITVGEGVVASMAAVILACGDHRQVYRHAQVLIHQLMGGTGMAQQTDIEIVAQHTAAMRAELDELYTKIVKNLNAQAKLMGYHDYSELSYVRMNRIGYGQAEIQAFRDQVARDVVPELQKVMAMRAKRTGITHPTFTDLPIIFKDGNPKPIPGYQARMDAARTMYHELSPETAEFIDFMQDNELFDVESRPGKMSGGYMTSLPSYKAPFIFANWNNTSGDVDVLTHECGHAFEGYVAERDPNVPADLECPAMESAEIHSMAMEFLTAPWHHLLFGKDTEKYALLHAEDSFVFLAYGCAVDEFQHIMYQNPDLTPDQRNAEWLKLEKKYRPWIDFDNLPFYGRGAGWQRQLHIYECPFYYIDYCLSTMAALQFFLLSLDDHKDAWERYLKLVRRAGLASYTELLQTAGLKVPFAEGSVKGIAQQMTRWLEEHQVG